MDSDSDQRATRAGCNFLMRLVAAVVVVGVRMSVVLVAEQANLLIV